MWFVEFAIAYCLGPVSTRDLVLCGVFLGVCGCFGLHSGLLIGGWFLQVDFRLVVEGKALGFGVCGGLI